MDNSDLAAGEKIGLFSYGSGAVSEFFSMTLMEDYKKSLTVEANHALLADRQSLSIAEYEKMFSEKLPTDGGTYSFSDSSDFAINKISEDIRYYNK